jgi:imidazole glycerol-phosphate synthase subunit HisH
MIHIIDFGFGNVIAYLNAYRKMGIDAVRVQSTKDLETVEKIILPGVGSFPTACSMIESAGFRESLNNLVVQQGVPVLGVCIGMHLFGNTSEEGVGTGFGWVQGSVKKFRDMDKEEKLRLPHMGWNTISAKLDCVLMKGIDKNARFFFLHSYHFECANPSDVIAETSFGQNFTSIVQRKNIFGVQFHPEKSGFCGATVLQNFAEL